ncbi:PREDICTED: protein distal antenna-related-like [Bactrocera latifrons]|uniref:protein distal antenna-related-like n=1 Tax=Bactrocera latifrons TaxID=174628 RepID=UPI0008DE9067|nr:PREDICTED: protein distal antenna-related-like [Bactrocera latifrons]
MELPVFQQLNIRMRSRGKRPLRNLTPNDKIRAIQRIHQGETKASVSRDIGVPESTLRGWCKNEHKLRFMYSQMNEKNEIELIPIYKLDNFQPAAKIYKLDGRDSFNSVINTENLIEFNEMSNLNSIHLDVNYNNYENALLEETLSDFLRNKSLPDSNEMMKQKLVIKGNQISPGLCSIGQTLSSISTSTNYKEYHFSPYNLNYYSKLNSSFMSAKSSVVSSSFERSKPKHQHPINKNIDKSVLTDPFNEKNDLITYNKWSNILSESTNTETIKASTHNTEWNDCNMLGITNRDGINNDKNIVDQNNSKQCNNESRLLQWYKVFNTSLNFLTLSAIAATLQPNPVYVHGHTDMTECISETQNNIQSYYESEPEDLSKKISKTSMSISSQSHSSNSFFKEFQVVNKELQ